LFPSHATEDPGKRDDACPRYGTVPPRYGTILYQYGTISYRYGTVSYRYGTISYQYGTVSYRYETGYYTKKEFFMATFHDYIPYNDAEFNTWFKNLTQYVSQKTSGSSPAWTHIPPAEVTAFGAAYAAWYTVYSPTLVPHTPAVTLAKDRGRDAAEEVIRPFVGQWLMWKQVTDAEREEMGLHNKQPRREHIPAPSTVPELSPHAGLPRQVVVPYRDQGEEGWGKPKDVHGIEVCWAILDHPPTSVKELIHSSFDTKSPLTLTFDEEDRGKRLYLAGRWEIEREGIKGEFGEIVTVIIP
jgi:hypothetical protein